MDENARVHDHHHNPSIDTSRPFRSVKEAVAVFGERILATGSFAVPKQETPRKPLPPMPLPPQNPMRQSSRDHDDDHKNELALTTMLKKLEAELEDTKRELNVLKERESETEIALASLNAELHKNMSKMAEAEAAAAAKAATAVTTRSSLALVVGGGSGGRRARTEQSSSLAKLLSFGEKEGCAKQKKMMMMKKKPIIPLLGDIFSSSRMKKSSSNTTLHNPLFAASQMCFS